MRFLKKEWDDTQVPGQALLRARNRAWKRIQEGSERSRPPLRLPAWAAGAAAATASLCLLWLLWPVAEAPAPLPAVQPPQPQIASKPPLAPQPVVRDAQALTGLSQDRLAPDAEWAPPALPERAAISQPEPPRKMIFRLPRSGVRMIWMTQSTQTSEGE